MKGNVGGGLARSKEEDTKVSQRGVGVNRLRGGLNRKGNWKSMEELRDYYFPAMNPNMTLPLGRNAER